MNRNNGMKIMLFVYNFKHKKSVDFIYKFLEENMLITTIVAADYVQIEKPKKIPNFRISSKTNKSLEHPRDVAKKFNIPYFILEHNSERLVDIINQYSINLGFIGGARILKSKTIRLFKYGIINFHPALLPECRGVDSLFWSIYHHYPLGVTSHLINKKIDCGNILMKRKINISSNDNLFTIHEKIYNLQLDLIKPSFLKLFLNDSLDSIEQGARYNTYMPEDIQKKTLKKVDNYIKAFS